MHNLGTTLDEQHQQLDKSGDDEGRDRPGHHSDQTLKPFNQDDPRPKDHHELIRYAAQRPTLALREEHLPRLRYDGESLGAEGLGGLLAGKEAEYDGSMDAVFCMKSALYPKPSPRSLEATEGSAKTEGGGNG